MKRKFKALFAYILDPHFLICFLIAWTITNGWAYLFLLFGILSGCTVLISIGTAYLTFLWFPCTPEKIVTIFIASKLRKKLYPEDEKAARLMETFREKSVSE